jgi:hypothetical protein
MHIFYFLIAMAFVRVVLQPFLPEDPDRRRRVMLVLNLGLVLFIFILVGYVFFSVRSQI